MILYPASQKTAVDSSGHDMGFSGRRPGMASSQVCVERSVAPFGSKMEMGFAAICLLHTGASVVRKWPVAPVSLMAVSNWRVAWDGCCMGA